MNKVNQAPMILRSPLLDHHQVAHGFATRCGGVSAGPYATLNFGIKRQDRRENVQENLRRLATRVGFAPENFFRVNQVHGTRVLVVDEKSSPEKIIIEEADALVTRTPSLALGALTADCVPVLFADPKHQVIGSAHAGWRGLADGILASTINAMCNQVGASRDHLIAAIGPCIGVCCYEVGPEVAQAFSFAPEAVVAQPGCKPHLNLTLAAHRALEQAGLAPSRISSIGLCTYCHSELFFSYRREGDDVGHHLSVISLGKI